MVNPSFNDGELCYRIQTMYKSSFVAEDFGIHVFVACSESDV